MAEFLKKRLKNGLTIVFEKRNLPITSVLIATRAGAAHEIAEKKGMAHFSEHMLLKATKTRNAQEFSSAIEKAGGILNGFTSDEITAYWCKIPSNHFETGFEIISDVVQNPKFDAKDIEMEKNIILSEISRCHDDPLHYLFDRAKELLYKNPFGMPILGFKKTVSSMNRGDFLKWHEFYCPRNLIVSIVGSADFAVIEDMARSMEKPERNLDLPTPVISKTSGNFIEKRAGLDQTHFILGMHMPSLTESRRYASEIFNAILGEGMSSILHQEIREKRGLAYAIKSILEQEKSYGHSMIYAGIDRKNIRKVKDIILKEIKSISAFSARDFEEAKEQKIGNWELELEACDKVATYLALQEIATKAEDFYKYPEKISQVKLQDFRTLAKIKNYSTAVLAPN